MPALERAPSHPGLFGPEWAERFERELQTSESFRAAARSWKGSLAFVLTDDSTPGAAEGRAVFIDLVHGSARAVRPALPGDLASATFRIDGAAADWHGLLSGAVDPSKALLAGGLRMVRGSFFSLLPHLKAARELFACARTTNP